MEAIANGPNGMQKLKREEKFILDKIRGLRSDIDTWENNLGFFSKSSAENPMVTQIAEKIKTAQKQIQQQEEKLKSVRNFIKQQNNPTAPAPDQNNPA
jgi:predicted DNA-binding protein YlxM (UPF0122 family)